MVPFLVFLVILGLSVGLLSIWRRNRRPLAQMLAPTKARVDKRTDDLEKANEDLKRAQAELHRRWQYLAEAQRLSHSGTFGWKVRSGELVWSDETYRILGLTRETNPTLDLVFDRIHPEDRDHLQQLRDRATQNGVDLDVEHRILLPDGVIKYVHVVAHAGRDDSGDLEYMGVVSDITERKRADEERQALSRNLQESKARLEEAQRVAHMGHYYWDLAANRVIWSDELYRIYGLTPREGPIDIAMVREMMHPDDRESGFRAAEELVRNGVNAETEHRVVRPDGEVRTVQVVGTVKRDASGRAYEMFGTVQDITERKRSEEERQLLSRDLQESKAWLEEAQRVTHVGYWVWDLESNRLIVSDEYCRILGLTPTKGPIDLTIVREIVHPEDREYVFRTAEEAVRSGERADCEHRIVRPNGELRVVHSLGDLKKDSSGRPYQLFGTTQDITDRKRAEEALRRSQFYLSEGERLAHMGSWAAKDLGIRWSNDLGIYWSDEVYKIFGLDPQNGPPNLEQYLAAVHPDDRASMEETIRMMHEQRCGCDVTKRIVRPDGEVRYVRCVGVPVFEDGVFKTFHGTTIDVTEQELLTQELRRERAYLAEAQSLTHAGSWASNLVTRQVFHSSEENNRLYGFDVSQNPNPFDLHYNSILAEDEPALTTKLETAIRAGADFDVEYRIRRADGAIRFLRGIGHHNPAHEFGEYFGITIDITDRKRAEEERERLRQLEADLAHINRVNMMGELAAALAHEIKQPISASITSANALLRWLAHDPPDLERVRAAATRIEQDGNRAADVINRLRSFYKKGAPPEREIVDVKEIIQEMIVLLSDEAVRHSITIHSEIDAETPNILADRVQLQQVFMNLILNAIEAMKDAGGQMTIKSGLNQDNQLLISISDTGIGLPLENTERIFDAFHTTKPQGTGMGLAITRSIMESHGGRIWATANHGAGATFHFTLPVDAEAHA
jgi:PAS domain S-box-containing protein